MLLWLVFHSRELVQSLRGAYFVADVGVLVTTGRSIGDYVDDAVGSPLVTF